MPAHTLAPITQCAAGRQSPFTFVAGSTPVDDEPKWGHLEPSVGGGCLQSTEAKVPIPTMHFNGTASTAQRDPAAIARRMMYDWHGGQASALYAAASSGLVKDPNLLLAEIEDIVPEGDVQRVALDWLRKELDSSMLVEVQGREYLALPWCARA